MEFTAFGWELEVQKRPRKATACWAVWVTTVVFLVATELLVLCRDMVLRLQAVAGSLQGFSWSRYSCFSPGFLSR